MLLRDEFLARLGITESELKEWQDLKLLMPDGITSENVSFFTKRSIEKAQKIKELANIGYGFREIQRIVKKIGLPVRENSKEKSDKVSKYLTVGLLAERVGVSPRTIKHWEDKGIIESDMRSEGGFRLYSEIYTYLCKLIRDLQLFGYSLEEIKEISDLFRDFLVMEKNLERYPAEENEKKFDVMLKKIEKFYEKIDLFKNGIERWDELLTKKRKEILSLKQQNKKRKKSKGKKK